MSKKKKKQTKKKQEEKELEIDLSKIVNFSKKLIKSNAFKKYAYLLLLIIPIFLAANFRMYPAHLPIAEDWAESSIYNNIKNNIANQINTQYPNLPTANKQKMIDENFNTFLEENKAQVEEGIRQNADYLRGQFKNDNGETYLLAIDPYTYYRQTKNMVEKGYAYDVEIEGVAYNNHMYAPKGGIVNKKFSGARLHVWFATVWHKMLGFFNRDISVMGSIFYVPVIISALSVIPAFFLARKVGGNLAGLFAAIIVGVHPVFLGRTAGGFSDTDAYNVFFPLLISWLFIEAFEQKDFKKKIIFASLAGIATGFYSFAWSAWWYIFDFIIISMIGYIIYYLILHRDELKKGIKKYLLQKDIKNSFLILLTFFVISGFFVTLFNNFEIFYNALLNPISRLTLKESAKANLWPNVYTTVAELNEASLSSIINGIGGKFMFLIALLGMIMTISSTKEKKNLGFLAGSLAWFLILISIQNKLSLLMFIFLLGLPITGILLYYLYEKRDDIDIKYAIFFIIWFLGTIFTTTKGIRFLLLMVPVYGVAVGIAIGKIYRYVNEWATNEFEMNEKVTKTLIIIFLLLLLLPPLKDAKATAKREVPSMNDGWYNSLNKINLEAQPDAIINSWWDFGHWFKAFGDRAVTFDGASQNTPMAHWIGRSLLTNNQDEAIGILRMLDCGSNDAFETLKNSGFSTVNSVDVLHEVVLTKNDFEASKVLQEASVNSDTIKKVLSLSHCEPPENYYITSEDMIGKSGVWAHFGSWDFRRALIWNDYRNLPKSEFDKKTEELGFSQNDSTKMFYEVQSISEGRQSNDWIAPWPSYASGLSGCQENGEIIICSNGLNINKTGFDAYVNTQQGILHPKKFSYVEENEFRVKEYEKGRVLTTNNGLFLGASLLRLGNTYYSILMSEELVDSMFNRLFYYDGLGLDNFDKFSDLRDVTGARIIVWKVDWNGKPKVSIEDENQN